MGDKRWVRLTDPHWASDNFFVMSWVASNHTINIIDILIFYALDLIGICVHINTRDKESMNNCVGYNSTLLWLEFGRWHASFWTTTKRRGVTITALAKSAALIDMDNDSDTACQIPVSRCFFLQNTISFVNEKIHYTWIVVDQYFGRIHNTIRDLPGFVSPPMCRCYRFTTSQFSGF